MTALTQPQTQPQVQTYATPSWSLAIASQSSPLAKWWGKPLAQTLTFTLVFQGETHQTHPGEIARGEIARGQTSQGQTSQGQTFQDETNDEPLKLKIKVDQSQLQLLAEVTEDYVEQVLSAPSSVLGESGRSPESLNSGLNHAALESRSPQGAPSFQSNSLLSHQLRLAGLDPDHSQSAVQLSTTEIFDLAEILNQATQNITVLPSSSAVRLFPKTQRAWTKTAAVAAFALITTGGLALLFGREGQFQTANQPESKSNPSADQAGVARPNQPGGPNQPTALNPQNSNGVPPTKGTSNAGKPSSKAQTNTKNQNLGTSTPQTSPSAQPQPSSPSTASSTASSTSRRSSSPTTDNQRLNQQRQRLPNSTEKDSSIIASRLSPSPDPRQSETRASRSQSAPALSAEPSASSDTSPQFTPAEKARNLARRQEISDKLAALENSGPQSKGLGSNAEPGATKASPNSPVSAPIPAPDRSALGESNDTASESFNSGAVGVPPANVSPVAQVTSYFKARWQGQASIQETLSYDLVLNQNGTVQSIAPQNTLAQQSGSKVSLPTVGQALTSPFSSPETQRLTVNLKPDGTVTVTQGGL